ncbi:cytochrome ubiquinol oxidase subunit I [Desulfogranum japonicum]|uniref:cytochrome ubiquinol oxidase subunit I n=1 Tax=Desulfogranum japonicum TaxID=231447 RepID=UPI000409DEBC|nr:cytochrome ubiquinol oxidase subunit I [Desulfogranum japonicum]
MNYPVWQLEAAGGGLLIALIAVFHVYIAHFAVGGGLFLVLTELKALRENNGSMMEFVRRHARFFVLVTMVAGGITGVGIWFTIALLNPAATSVLIHTFVFGWAIEWVFFLIEIVALFIYASTFDKLPPRQHLLIGWIYFGAAWLSLFMINGIIGFMLTPGQWLENGNFWSGFFNPTFWPSLCFRTFFSILIAGLFGLVTATWSRNPAIRIQLTRYSALWLLIPFTLFLMSGFWYKGVLPAELQQTIFERMPATAQFVQGFIFFSPVLLAGCLLLAIRMPGILSRPLALTLLVAGLLYMGCFEYIREGGRRPFIIYDYMYSNGILTKDAPKVSTEGLLKHARWSKYSTITPDNQLAAGKEVFTLLCSSCHSVDGPTLDIRALSRNYTPASLDNMIRGMHHVYPSMPPFIGTDEERKALAWYLAYGLNGRMDRVAAPNIAEKTTEPHVFNPDQDEYVLLAWSSDGMHTFADALPYWSFRQPGNTVRAQLVRRGETPEVVENATILYQVESSFQIPGAYTVFWDAALQKFKWTYPVHQGYTGPESYGEMIGQAGLYLTTDIRVVPYPDQNTFDPYPLLTLEAENQAGDLLATTTVPLPVSTEMGCNSCHGGQWRVADRAGFMQSTALNILSIHDKLSNTQLVEQAAQGKPVICQDCHAEEHTYRSQMNLSASMHGFHAVFLSHEGTDACAACHPSSSTGATQMLRGIHNVIGLECTNCHGNLAEHALDLLKQEENNGLSQATEYSRRIVVEFGEIADITPRSPWSNQPDCLHCHVEFAAPETDSTLHEYTEDMDSLYRNRTDESGALYCAACHGSPHALYPASNDYGTVLHNLVPLQYQDEPLPMGSNFGCAVCHTTEMEDEMHHPNILGEFRNL